MIIENANIVIVIIVVAIGMGSVEALLELVIGELTLLPITNKLTELSVVAFPCVALVCDHSRDEWKRLGVLVTAGRLLEPRRIRRCDRDIHVSDLEIDVVEAEGDIMEMIVALTLR